MLMRRRLGRRVPHRCGELAKVRNLCAHPRSGVCDPGHTGRDLNRADGVPSQAAVVSTEIDSWRGIDELPPDRLALTAPQDRTMAHGTQSAQESALKFRFPSWISAGRPRFLILLLAVVAFPSSLLRAEEKTSPEGEGFFFTPPGSQQVGKPITFGEANAGRVRITVLDAATGEPTFCRINVIGPDGHYYQPPRNYLSEYALTGDWPDKGAWGNRKEKAPWRYLGRFFYAWGQTAVAVPPGRVQIEIWKGYEYRPQRVEVAVEAGTIAPVEVRLERTAGMSARGWHSGDPHLHIPRESARDDEVVLDLLEAEDIRYGSILGYNEPAGPYSGFMEKLAAPQQRGLGPKSHRERAGYHIQSGQEYRNTTYGHILLFGRDELVFPGQDLNADNWPVYGLVARDTMNQGGQAAYAHGGYRQELYADVALGALNAIELLQFGIYREVGLTDWYHMLNSGYRIPCLGASDWPACRWLGDCRTYVAHDGEPTFAEWLQGMSAGRSFMTTGPLLLLEVNGSGPGTILERTVNDASPLKVKIEWACEVTPVQHLDLLVGGVVHESIAVTAPPAGQVWQTIERELQVTGSTWIAVRARSTTAGGQPDAEAHTNPVYVDVAGRRAWQPDSLDAWVERLDSQIARHRARTFPEKARVLDYFQAARDQLLKVRAKGGLASGDDPAADNAGVFAPREQAGLESDASDAFPSAEQLKAYLQPVPAKSPREALQTFEMQPGFEMQLVAAEPEVFDPVAAAFDADGQLYVCEMRDYPYRPAEGADPIGSVRLLRDLDRDGTYETSTVFADKLLWAAGVAPYRGGVFIAAPPDIWYCRDTDNDGIADERRRVFTGFGTGNQQGMLNNLAWGPDHWIYGSTANNAGVIRHVDRPDQAAVDLAGRDFRFDPVTETFESISGTVQFGNTFDDFGNRFTCSESQPLLQIVLPQHYLARNPYLPVPSAIKNLAPGPVPIFRTSPVERWRQIRSARRVTTGERPAESPGASHHVVDAAAGVTVYRGSAYPAGYYGTLFVGDGQNNLVHHRRLIPSGVTFDSERVEAKSEFVRSTDIWFRPVNFANAPDGTLFCLDMSREVLESIHVPLDVAEHLDFTSGRNNGRIYRIAPQGFVPRPAPRLEQAPGDDLVRALESPDGWGRDTAARLIFERQDRRVVPGLERLVKKSESAATRVAALWALQGLNALRGETLGGALRDDSARVRETALRLAEPHLDAIGSLRDLVLSMGIDRDPRVRFQLAFTLGESQDPRAAELLAKLARTESGDSWMRTAILSSVGRAPGRMLQALLADRAWARTDAGRSWLDQLAQIVGIRHDPVELDATLALIAEMDRDDAGTTAALVQSMANGLRRANQMWSVEQLRNLPSRTLVERETDRAVQLAGDSQAAEAARISAIGFLGTVAGSRPREVLEPLVSSRQPVPLQLAAIRTLGRQPDPAITRLFLDQWSATTPEVQGELLAQLLSRQERTLEFLKHAMAGEISLASLDATQRQLLLQHRSDEIRTLALGLLGAASDSARGRVVDDYRQAIADLKGVPERGVKVFERLCAGCHQVAGRGVNLGPNLASSASRDAGALVQHIFDPNQTVQPNYLQYVVIDRAGRGHSGLIAAQTATSITLRREKDVTETILRGDIEEMSCTGKSLMPEGLEKDLAPSELADLVAWLQQQADPAGTQAADPRKVRDKGTLPGTLIEPRSQHR